MGGRGVIRLKYVHAFRDRAGRMRYYFRCNGKQSSMVAEELDTSGLVCGSQHGEDTLADSY